MTLTNKKWISITSQYDNTCKSCGGNIDKGQVVLWKKGVGVKHQDCSAEPNSIESKIVKANSEKYVTWKDSSTYSYSELQKIKNCQRCGNDISKEKDSYIDVDRKVCSDCF